MAEHLLIPKQLARRLPWLKTAAWKLEVGLVRLLMRYLRAGSIERGMRIASRIVRRMGPWLPMWDKVARNHRIAFPDLDDAEHRTLQRETFGWLGTSVAELVLADRVWAEREQRFEFVADPSIEGLRDHSRPIVFATAHVGAWQYCNLIALEYGLPISTLFAQESNPYFAELMLELRERLGVRWVSNKGGIKTLVSELRSGHSVGLAVDTRMDQGEAVEFFGHPAMTNTVPARLALKQKCELVPIRVERLPDTRYRITLEKPVRPRDEDAAIDEQARDMTAQLLSRFEGWIQQTPSQWMCLARRWPKELDKQAR